MQLGKNKENNAFPQSAILIHQDLKYHSNISNNIILGLGHCSQHKSVQVLTSTINLQDLWVFILDQIGYFKGGPLDRLPSSFSSPVSVVSSITPSGAWQFLTYNCGAAGKHQRILFCIILLSSFQYSPYISKPKLLLPAALL